MREFKDKVGQVFGRLTVIEVLEKGRVLVKCECGTVKDVYYYDLAYGKTISCGCWNREKTTKMNTTHNQTNTRLYMTWQDMKKRCSNPKSIGYHNYGGRGIKVCEEWKNDFQSFYDWAMANGYTDELTIDRIDVNGNYEPNNCRWATIKEQGFNRRNNHLLTFNGITKTMMEWSMETGLNYDCIRARINDYGWSVEKALTTQSRGKKNG